MEKFDEKEIERQAIALASRYVGKSIFDIEDEDLPMYRQRAKEKSIKSLLSDMDYLTSALEREPPSKHEFLIRGISKIERMITIINNLPGA